MDILSTTREIIEIVDLVIEKCNEYGEADSVIKATRTRLDGVQVRVELFQEFMKLSESTMLFRRKQVLHRSLETVFGFVARVDEHAAPFAQDVDQARLGGLGQAACRETIGGTEDMG